MATPPPEAAPVLKEEKPQLPPSPTGASAPDVAPTSATNDVKMHGTDAPSDKKSPVLNGNGHPAVASVTNGTGNTTSPPKSPAPAVDTLATPAPAESIPSAVTSAVIPKQSDAAITPGATSNPEDKPAVSDAPAPVPALESGSLAGALDGSNDGKMELDGPQEPPVAQPLKTELPLHPTTDSTPSLPPVNTDRDMKDAPLSVPLSPSKVSREREADNGEEPAAKRTKVDGENGAAADIKLPDLPLPTPATQTTASIPTAGKSGVTKLQHKFLTKCVSSLKRMHDSRFYREPVDPVKLNIPNYLHVITHPMDISTIERKLKANDYSSPQALINDFNLMVQNSLTFNGPDHLVAQEGQKLKVIFDKQMINLPKPDEVEEKKSKKSSTEKTSAARREPRTSLGSTTQPAKAASPPSASTTGTTFALGPEGLPTIRRDSFNPDGRPKRSIHPPKRDLPYSTKPKKKKYQWELRFCQEVLDELHKPKHHAIAIAFYYPVDPVALNIPTYHSVIKKPMDMSTAQNKLKTGQYENAKEFESDIRLMLKNCFRFNLKGDPTYLAGESLQAVFDQKWKELPQYLEKHEPHQEQHTDSSEDESDEDADESENEDNEKLSLLQKQIAEMSRQVEMITQKKKKTPPSSKKVGKSKSGKKDGKKSSSGSKKDKKSSLGKGPKERTRLVTYAEKQVISHGISNLPDKKMHEALGIIQSNVPALKGTQEAEIELDIDELPNDVLVLLLNFVRKNTNSYAEDEETSPATNYAAPKPKKNKPMSSAEQEAQITTLQSNLSRFASGGAPVPSVENNDSSEDESDEDSEESEEE
ncbi:transcription regulator BDF1 [Penicillium malachiteum]|nr:transcription regulator BDF1 [Penicillium malachiteum]